jgi:prevent-host-death family protein
VLYDQLDGQEAIIGTVSLADAKAHLSELIEQAASGDPVYITRRGKLVAQLTAIGTPRERIDPEKLRAVTDGTPWQSESAGDFIRRMRDEDRY